MSSPPPLSVQTAPEPPAPAPIAVPFQRDRIVVIGRTQAGKTVYITRLYHELWSKPQRWLSMRALSGVAHTALMKMCGDMANGQWPGTTVGQRYVDCELKFNGTPYRMTLLDYPGEVFTKAFVLGESDTEDTTTLLDHIDHARGVLLLIDPKNAVDARDPVKRADDDFGMTAVVDRIRSFPGGKKVPIAIVVTKCDIHENMIHALGGLKKFAEDYLLWITRTAKHHYRVFPCAAVRPSRENRAGGGAPDLSKPPVNVVEPLKWILELLESDVRKGQIIVDQDKKEKLISSAIAQVRELIYTTPTEANFEKAKNLLRQLPDDAKQDVRVKHAYAELKAAAVDHGVRREEIDTRRWILFTVGTVVLLLIGSWLMLFYKPTQASNARSAPASASQK